MAATNEPDPGASLVGEHRLQLDLLAAVQRAVGPGGDRSQVDGLLERLSEYTEIHFASEQLLMRFYGYPGYQGHMDEHDRSLAWLDALRVSWRGGNADITGETAAELAKWIEGHMRRADHAFEQYMDELKRQTP